jgi:predicted  nucleic acid-binding Zn-ribbon protein
MRPVELLARLNEMDLAVDVLEARRAEIAAALREPAALQAARRALAAAEAEVARCRAAQADRELAQKGIADRLTRAEQRLYGGQIRNPKELEDVERDVQQLRRQLRQADDDLLEVLIAAEAAAENQQGRAVELKRLTAEWEATQAALCVEQAQLKKRLSVARAHQSAARQAVPADLLPLYDNLRARRAGRAVAELDGDTCSACRVAAPPGKLGPARYDEELVYCGNCGRLLWGEYLPHARAGEPRAE